MQEADFYKVRWERFNRCELICDIGEIRNQEDDEKGEKETETFYWRLTWDSERKVAFVAHDTHCSCCSGYYATFEEFTKADDFKAVWWMDQEQATEATEAVEKLFRDKLTS